MQRAPRSTLAGLRGRRGPHRLAALVAALLAGGLLPPRPAQAAERRLEREAPPSGQPLPLEIRQGQVLAFSLALSAGDYVQVVLASPTGDLATTALAPGGAPLGSTQTSDDGDPAPLSLVAARAGTYRFEVRLRPGYPRATFQLLVDGPRPATPEDQQRVVADAALAAGDGAKATAGAAGLEEARARYQEALERYEALGDARAAAAAWSLLCALLERRGDPAGWLTCVEEEVPRWRKAGLPRREAEALTDMATALHEVGDDRGAMEQYQAALPLRRAAGDRIGEAQVLAGMGSASGGLGDHQRAVQLSTQAIGLLQLAGYRWGEAMTLTDRAAEHDQLGEPWRAVADLRRSLAIFEALKDRRFVGITLAFLGRTELRAGQPREALAATERAVGLFRQVGDRRFEGRALQVMGSALVELGRPAEARARLEQALVRAREQEDRRSQAIAGAALSRAALALGDRAAARASAQEALELARAGQDPGLAATALVQLALAERAEGDLDGARGHLEEALELTEQLRGAIAGADLRSSYLATTQRRYGLLIDLLMELDRRRPGEGLAARAFEVSERGRARGLVELLAESHADVREGIDPALLEEERSVEAELDARAQALARAHPAQRQAVASALEELGTRYRDLQTEIRARSPRYAALTQPPGIGAEEVERELVDPDTVLLEYALGEERSFLWVVSRTGLTAHELPPRATIEARVRKVYGAWSAPGPAGGGGPAAAALARLLLGPAAGELPARRWLVVADGALQYLPFAALPAPGGGRVVDGHEVVSLPSAGALVALRAELAGRPAPEQTLTVLADPVFSAADPRVRVHAGPAPPPGPLASASPLTRSRADSGLEALERLPGTRREAEEIAGLVPPGERLVALDFAASRETAAGLALGRSRYVHLATHALVDARRPELSGLVLSLVDRDGRPAPGFLQAHELYNLRLSADLVVLSACETALGKEVRGEGLVGLARGFMYAGAPRVVASLWKVPDLATAELMRRFYRALLRDGLAPASALQAAQASMARSGRWSDPNAWAGFVLLGEWR